MAARIKIENLNQYYGKKQALKDVSLTIESGMFGLLGRNGAGKTTLLRILMGLEAPDGGSVEGLDGRPISAVFQEDRLCPHLNAAGNIRLVGSVCSDAELQEDLLALLPADSLLKPVSSFSGGMRRRVSLLRAMQSQGEILLFDEPFNGLDEQIRQDAVHYVQRRRNNRTLLFTTHHMEEARALKASLFVWDGRPL